ncbi:MAG: winged helix-turn-helix domain-containing protein [Paraglaciecola sp.]|uniref:winged helix-turn-helix domain-containing protein n=1 Tax=Paraglaciecola sp. TaxID=1920173 RepID=UPI003299C26E
MYNIRMMTDSNSTPKLIYHFADWHFNPVDGLLSSKQKSLRLQPRLSQLLQLLLSNQGNLLSRNELIEVIWKDKLVNEDALSRCIAELRAALGDNTAKPIYIETLPKKGYRFIHEVQTQSNNPSVKSVTQSVINYKYALIMGICFLSLIYIVSQFAKTNTPSAALKSALITAQRLTTDSEFEHQPALSSLGDKIAFSVTQQQRVIVKVLDLDGETLFEIRDPKQHLVSATFSPDDKQLLVAALSDKSCTVYVYQLPSLQREPLTSCLSPNSAGIIDWSADGQLIAYVNRDASTKDDDASEVAAIWQYNVQSKQHRQITFPQQQHIFDTRPRFSPDGKYLAFTRGNDSIRNLHLTQLGKPETTTVATNLTQEAAFITSFSWLKGSQGLLYDSNVLGDRNLWLVDINQQQKELLGARDAKYPSLDSQNTRLAFHEVRYNANIWQLDLTVDNPSSEPIIQSIKYNNFPRYSPDGKQIAFVSNRKGKAAIWLYSLETKKQRQILAIEDADLVLPNWSFDGSHLLVSSRSATGYRCYQINLASKLYQPLYGMSGQYHGCHYAADGNIFAISKQPEETSFLIKITQQGQVTQLSDFSVERLHISKNNQIVYSRTDSNALYSMEFNGNNQQVLIDHLDSQVKDFWSVQGNYLYYAKLGADKGIWRSSLVKNDDLKITDILPTAIGVPLAVSPDHNYLIYSQTDSRQADIYLAEIPNS